MFRHCLVASLFGAALTLGAQQPKPNTTGGLVIRLEQLRNEKVIPVRPEHVFTKDDVVRFRLKSPLDGYIYVVDHATSGEYTVLFPSSASVAANEVHGEAEFYVPSPEDGWFQVGGEAGFDTVYFLLSPIKLAVSTLAAKSKPADKLPTTMTPRCNDKVFQARGECIDESAGAAMLPRGAALPPQIATAAANASRDLVLVNDQEGNVKVTKTSDGPAIYVFRIAHQ